LITQIYSVSSVLPGRSSRKIGLFWLQICVPRNRKIISG